MSSIITKLFASGVAMGAMKILKSGAFYNPPACDPRERFPDLVPVTAKAKDGSHVAGWAHMPPKARCTIIMSHGFLESSKTFWIVDLAAILARELPAAIVAVDMRSHGGSGDAPPSLGEAESWDMAAGIDWAVGKGFPEPIMLYGVSLGGMAARLLALDDARVAAVYTRSAPACAQAAASNHHKMCGLLALVPVISTIFEQAAEVARDAYGWDIIGAGDARTRPSNPAHGPLIMACMGEQDPYGHDEALAVWRHHYTGKRAEVDKSPRHARNQRKWFVTVKGAGHGWAGPEYPDLMEDMLAFYRLALSQNKKQLKA